MKIKNKKLKLKIKNWYERLCRSTKWIAGVRGRRCSKCWKVARGSGATCNTARRTLSNAKRWTCQIRATKRSGHFCTRSVKVLLVKKIDSFFFYFLFSNLTFNFDFFKRRSRERQGDTLRQSDAGEEGHNSHQHDRSFATVRPRKR